MISAGAISAKDPFGAERGNAVQVAKPAASTIALALKLRARAPTSNVRHDFVDYLSRSRI
jgi:hypothetical protein